MSLRNRTIAWPIRGAIAGFAGTLAMSSVYAYAHNRRPGVSGVAGIAGIGGHVGLDYDDSGVPGRIAQRILHLPKLSDRQAGQLTLAIRWSYGSAFGVAHVLLRSRIREPYATGIFGASLMTLTFTMFPILGKTPPPWKWTGEAKVTSIATHIAYITTAAVTDDILRGRNKVLYEHLPIAQPVTPH